jgi:hypothetical protein
VGFEFSLFHTQSVARHAERLSARAKAMSASSRRRSMVLAEHERNLNLAVTLPCEDV